MPETPPPPKSFSMADTIIYSRNTDDTPREGMTRIVNRFGKLDLDPRKALHVKGGMLGFPAVRDFCLLNYPGRDDIKLLQAVNENDLCFMVLPQRVHNDIHAFRHIRAACEEEGFNTDNVMLLLVVSVHTEKGRRMVSCNAKAPVFYDCLQQVARQKALIQGDYDIRLPI